VKHSDVTDDIRERAALHVLGALSAEAAREFERHLDEGCTVCAVERDAFAAVAADLAVATPSVSPRPELRSRLLQAAPAERCTERAAGFHFMRGREGAWIELAPGVLRKSLAGRPGTPPATYLVRLAPDTVVDAHTHGAVEHCYVLEGDLLVAGERLVAGDYHEAPAGSVHRNLGSEGGCLLLIVESHS
jgi:quercetin dioxygenase-like cupin family protein